MDGIGPLRLVRNKMSYAAFKGTRTLQKAEEWDKLRLQMKPAREETEKGLIIFAGGHSMNTTIPNWLDRAALKEQLDKHPNKDTDLKI